MLSVQIELLFRFTQEGFQNDSGEMVLSANEKMTRASANHSTASKYQVPIWNPVSVNFYDAQYMNHPNTSISGSLYVNLLKDIWMQVSIVPPNKTKLINHKEQNLLLFQFYLE